MLGGGVALPGVGGRAGVIIALEIGYQGGWP
jgi:hypothetical protein